MSFFLNICIDKGVNDAALPLTIIILLEYLNPSQLTLDIDQLQQESNVIQ